MRKYAYVPTVGDHVTTVSLSRGRVVNIDGDVLTVKHTGTGLEGQFYVSVGAVIKSQNESGSWVYEHRSVADRAHPSRTTMAESIFDRYFRNKRVSSDRAA